MGYYGTEIAFSLVNKQKFKKIKFLNSQFCQERKDMIYKIIITVSWFDS